MRLGRELAAASAILLLSALGAALAMHAVIGGGAAAPSGGEPAAEVAVVGVFQLFVGICLRNLAAYAVLLCGLWTAGLLSVATLAYNGFRLGTGVSIALAAGVTPWQILLLLAPHGVLELPALVLGGALGLRGWGLARSALATDSFQPGAALGGVARLALWGALVIVLAALVEASVTRELLIRSLQ